MESPATGVKAGYQGNQEGSGTAPTVESLTARVSILLSVSALQCLIMPRLPPKLLGLSRWRRQVRELEQQLQQLLKLNQTSQELNSKVGGAAASQPNGHSASHGRQARHLTTLSKSSAPHADLLTRWTS